MDPKIITEISSKFNPANKGNLRRLSNPYGGYQDLIRKRFHDLLDEHYSSFYSKELVEFLFPSLMDFPKLGRSVYNDEYQQLFHKYN